MEASEFKKEKNEQSWIRFSTGHKSKIFIETAPIIFRDITVKLSPFNNGLTFAVAGFEHNRALVGYRLYIGVGCVRSANQNATASVSNLGRPFYRIIRVRKTVYCCTRLNSSYKFGFDHCLKLNFVELIESNLKYQPWDFFSKVPLKFCIKPAFS